MAVPIPEQFNEFPGELSNYDTPFGFSTTFLNQILTNQHVDVRSFDNNGIFRLRTQNDLDALTQTVLDTETQTQLEQVQTAPGEAWQATTTSGTTGSLFVGLLPERNNWNGAQITCNGSALDITLTSSMSSLTGGAVNISTQDFVGFVCPDFHTFNTATSTIQLCSNTAGDFTSNNSASVPFSSSTGTATYIKIGLGSFAAGGFDNTQVTGVKIRLVSSSNPTNGQKLTVMALRAVKSTWKPQTFDINTRKQVFTSAVTLDGGDPVAGTDAFVPLVRGVHNGTADPRPMDATLTMLFNTGALTASNNLTPYNQIELLFRENQTVSTGRYIVARLLFRNGSTQATSLQRVNNANVGSSIINYSSGLPTLTANSYYIFQADLTNQAMVMNIYQSNAAGNFLTKIWSSLATSTGTNASYVREQGRVGWNLSLVDRDVDLVAFNASTTSFSTMRTRVFNTYNPVDGAQLTATFASDTNLWSGFQGQDMLVDTSKSLSGKSYRATYPIFSNDFPVDDWAQMYIQFDIWVPAQATPGNQPYVSITSSDAFTNIILPKPSLQAEQWTTVYIDLNQAQGNITGIFYRLWVGSFNTQLVGNKIPYTFWVDNFFIGRRNVSWQFRANPSLGVWREFRDAVNDPYGALRLPPDERGTSLQLQAVALTQDAWISSYTLIPHFAELGKPTFY